MKKNVQESLDKIKYLYEFHFKPHSRADAVNDEQPVKFNEIGDVYKYKEDENDYPTFEQYRDDVMLDEDEPDNTEGQPQNSPAPIAQSQQEPVPAGQEPPAQAAPAAPESQPQPAEPAPAPMSIPEPSPSVAPVPAEQLPPSVTPEMEMFGQQLAKTDELLAKFNSIQQQLAGMEDVNLKLNDVEKKLEDLKNPPYEDQLEMISKNAYPYNIKLSDFWGWDKEGTDETEEPEEFKLSPDDISNYNKDDIKKSFTQ